MPVTDNIFSIFTGMLKVANGAEIADQKDVPRGVTVSVVARKMLTVACLGEWRARPGALGPRSHREGDVSGGRKQPGTPRTVGLPCTNAARDDGTYRF